MSLLPLRSRAYGYWCGWRVVYHINGARNQTDSEAMEFGGNIFKGVFGSDFKPTCSQMIQGTRYNYLEPVDDV